MAGLWYIHCSFKLDRERRKLSVRASQLHFLGGDHFWESAKNPGRCLSVFLCDFRSSGTCSVLSERTLALGCQCYVIEVREATSATDSLVHRRSNHPQAGVHV